MAPDELIATKNEKNSRFKIKRFHTVVPLKTNNMYITINNVENDNNIKLSEHQIKTTISKNFNSNRVFIQRTDVSQIIDSFKQHVECKDELKTTKFSIIAPQTSLNNPTTIDLRQAGNFFVKSMRKIKQGVCEFKEFTEAVNYLDATLSNIQLQQ